MNTLTFEKLNSSIWWRVIKFLCLATAIILTSRYLYNNYKMSKYLIIGHDNAYSVICCRYGTEKCSTIKKSKLGIESELSEITKQKVALDWCGYTGNIYETEPDKYDLYFTQNNVFTMSDTIMTSSTKWFLFLRDFLISLLAAFVSFELIKRTLYYILFGTIIGKNIK